MLQRIRQLVSPVDRESLLKGKGRMVRVHSVSAQPPEADPPHFYRLAFEFTDPPGPYSMQFIEFGPESADALLSLKPDAEIEYLESRDGARSRAIRLTDGSAVWPRVE